MPIVDFKAMKKDKEQFDSSADELMQATMAKKRNYATLYNRANMLKNEINLILLDINKQLKSLNIKPNKLITLFDFNELVEFITSLKVDGKDKEQLEIFVYRIKTRLDEINKLRTEMVQMDVYEGIVAGLEDDTLVEEYIDMDKIRTERGISILDKIDNVLESLNTNNIVEDNDDYISFKFDGLVTIRDLANNYYGNPSYWVYIYNYGDNREILNKIALDNNILLEELSTNSDILFGVELKVPKEIEFYSDLFNTTTLKKVS